MEFSLQLNDGDILELGDKSAARGGPLCARVHLTGVADACGGAPAELKLLRCGEEVAARRVDKDDIIEYYEPNGDPGWYRIELWQGQRPLVITNHIELTP